ncbi:Blp family class II bacteriocin [Collimonas sp.]|jgi:hypothetical protein|uniref:Blp family class II bacteriocin n=1 Tax=Collimonas sp. TaxID=1963772 RepID=UPI002BC38C5F|nr:hypothetical protein [Collimonas sp.]HWW05731.1 hypothetical protein [Collimonas sp.]
MAIKEMTTQEIQKVSGGTTSGDIAMGIAGGWASGVAGFAIGGPLGALVDFGLGAAIATGFSLSGGTFGGGGRGGRYYALM